MDYRHPRETPKEYNFFFSCNYETIFSMNWFMNESALPTYHFFCAASAFVVSHGVVFVTT